MNEFIIGMLVLCLLCALIFGGRGKEWQNWSTRLVVVGLMHRARSFRRHAARFAGATQRMKESHLPYLVREPAEWPHADSMSANLRFVIEVGDEMKKVADPELGSAAE